MDNILLLKKTNLFAFSSLEVSVKETTG